ncbi:MAG: hypothetical protein KDA85_20365, partial [Planctomycetaceae bacterium]|nr:hypothetical protein [Planctomycetaceae bacterium]
CYDFFFVTGFMYTDQKAPKDIRGQAQSLLVFLTQGVGMFFGYRIAFGGEFAGIPLDWTLFGYGKQVDSGAYVDALKEARGEQSFTFVESLQQMVNRTLPDSLDQELVSSTMSQWESFWVFPAIMAGIILAVFAVAFWDKAKTEDVSAETEAAAQPSLEP